MKTPEIICPQLSEYDETSIDSVQNAFQSVPSLHFSQTWLEQPDPDFRPGVVRCGWRYRALHVFAELEDTDIFSNATQLNQFTWELGDAFEMFLRPLSREEYVEFHVTPNNHRLQLRIPGTTAQSEARKSRNFEPFLIEGNAIHSRTWVDRAASKWFVLAIIPAETVGPQTGPLSGEEWAFSFSRYDATRGRPKPVISSTSPHPKPDFHSQSEWGTMRFIP